MELSYCQKNKWEDDWEQYWFYAKIGFPSDSSSEGVYYPFAAKVEELKHATRRTFGEPLPAIRNATPHLLLRRASWAVVI